MPRPGCRPNKDYRCTYVARQVEVKAAYRLWVTQAEHDAITRVLTDCGATPIPPRRRSPHPTPHRPTRRRPAPRTPRPRRRTPRSWRLPPRRRASLTRTARPRVRPAPLRCMPGNPATAANSTATATASPANNHRPLNEIDRQRHTMVAYLRVLAGFFAAVFTWYCIDMLVAGAPGDALFGVVFAGRVVVLRGGLAAAGPPHPDHRPARGAGRPRRRRARRIPGRPSLPRSGSSRFGTVPADADRGQGRHRHRDLPVRARTARRVEPGRRTTRGRYPCCGRHTR